MHLTKEQIQNELNFFYPEEDFSFQSEDGIRKIFQNHIDSHIEKIEIGNLFKNENNDKLIFIDTPDGVQEIGDLYIKSPKEILTVNTSDYKCDAADTHLFETQEGWKFSKDLTKKDYLLTKSGYQKIRKISKKEAEEVYDFEVLHENHRYWAGNGISSHNTGKTFIFLNMAREAQRKGYHIFWADSESAVDKQTFINFGIDPEGVHYQPVKTIKQFSTIVANMCQMVKEKMKKGWEVPKMMVVLDSVGNLSSGKERQDIVDGNDKRDMTKQQELAGMFRVLTVDLAEIKALFCLTNHTYDSIGGYIPTRTVKGGNAGIYNSSIILLVDKANLKSEDKSTDAQAEKIGMSRTGIIISVKPLKNRFARPIPIKIHLSFFKGMNPYVGLEHFVSWENCGIQLGSYEEIIREQPVLDEQGVQVIYRGKPKFEKVNTGEYEFIADEKSKTWAVKHLKKAVLPHEVFTSEVFTDEVLKMLDDKIIRPSFELPKLLDGTAELEEYFETDEDEVPNMNDIFKTAALTPEE